MCSGVRKDASTVRCTVLQLFIGSVFSLLQRVIRGQLASKDCAYYFLYIYSPGRGHFGNRQADQSPLYLILLKCVSASIATPPVANYSSFASTRWAVYFTDPQTCAAYPCICACVCICIYRRVYTSYMFIWQYVWMLCMGMLDCGRVTTHFRLWFWRIYMLFIAFHSGRQVLFIRFSE